MTATGAHTPPDQADGEALLLRQAHYVLKNLDAERPGAGYLKMAEACRRAADAAVAERDRREEAESAPGPGLSP